jgi:hypothetical protein
MCSKTNFIVNVRISATTEIDGIIGTQDSPSKRIKSNDSFASIGGFFKSIRLWKVISDAKRTIVSFVALENKLKVNYFITL